MSDDGFGQGVAEEEEVAVVAAGEEVEEAVVVAKGTSCGFVDCYEKVTLL